MFDWIRPIWQNMFHLLRKQKFCNILSLIYYPRLTYEECFEEKKIIISKYITKNLTVKRVWFW
jgi:hypothetical protein